MCFRRRVLRCSILHLEAAVRNPKLCRRLVHGCRKADVKQVVSYGIILEFTQQRIQSSINDSDLKKWLLMLTEHSLRVTTN